jgi:ABC-type nitrate/sulfonate/bicarbonate transport system substrate-binding protein
MRSKRRVLSAVCVAVLLGAAALTTAGCGGEDDDSGSGSGTKQVTLAQGPFLDNLPWVVAKDLGIDKEFGVNLVNRPAPAPQVVLRSMVRGDLDAGSSCEPCEYPFMKKVPDLRDWLITDQFKGFIVVGRKGETETFDGLVDEGADPETARQKVLGSFRGKTFNLGQVGLLDSLITTALEDGGVDPEAVEIRNFADDAKAALAFRGGSGDYYMGSLPQETKLLRGEPDKFVNVGGQEILGAGGLWYSSMVGLDKFTADHDLMMRLYGIWYRTMRYIKEQPDVAVPKLTDAINQAAAARFTPEEVQFLLKKFIRYMSVKEAQETVFNPSSPLYHGVSLDFYDRANKKQLPDDYEQDRTFASERLFNAFVKDEKTMAKVNAPLK